MNEDALKIHISCNFDMWGDLLSQLSEKGMSDLEAAIVGERFRRAELKRLGMESPE